MAVDINQIPEEIQAIVDAYPGEKRYILAIMQDLQKECNYLPREGLELIAGHTGIAFSEVYSLATFYKAFSLVPRGKYNIKVCDGTACHIKGSAVIIDQILNSLGIKPGETTEDRLFSLETVNCLGACAIAPVLMVNEKIYPKVSSSGLLDIIKAYGGHVHEDGKS